MSKWYERLCQAIEIVGMFVVVLWAIFCYGCLCLAVAAWLKGGP